MNLITKSKMKTKNQSKKNEADLINELKMAQRVGTKSLS